MTTKEFLMEFLPLLENYICDGDGYYFESRKIDAESLWKSFCTLTNIPFVELGVAFGELRNCK